MNKPESTPPALQPEQRASLVSLVVNHRIKTGQVPAYEAWLRRIIAVASEYPGHLGIDVIRTRSDGLPLFTCILRFSCTERLWAWLDSSDRRDLIAEVEPLLADGDQTSVNEAREFWFTPSLGSTPPPRWKQVCLTFLVILPLSLLVPRLWQPVFERLPWLGGYLAGGIVITLSIVLLVVYLFMPLVTRAFAGWLKA